MEVELFKSSKTAADAVSLIQSGQRVFIHGGVATPSVLLQALAEQSDRLRDVELIHLHTEGEIPFTEEQFKHSFRIVNLFVGSNFRRKINYDSVDYLPCFLSEIPLLFESGKKPIDVALLHLSPPNQHGFCTLGTNVDVARAASDCASIVIAQVNSQMPKVHGDGFINIDSVDRFIDVDIPIFTHPRHMATPEEREIGKNVSNLIEDGACLQVGVGSIPDAVLSELKGRRHLGVHSEMWSDGILELIKLGVIDNSRKKVHAGKSVSGFVSGSQELYDFINDNPSVIQLGVDYVNNPAIIAKNPCVTAINSAVAVDLTGQICADSIGSRIISGVGGQMDFIRGASLSQKGKPIIALTSRTKKGISRIVSVLQSGSGVVTTRANARYVVTEYGIADLFGRTLGERARELIKIAHPEDRESLDREWYKITHEN